MSRTNREIHLVKRPDGPPALDDFKLVEAPLPEIADGQVLIQQLYMSVDPAMRPRLTNGYELGQAMSGGALGRIVQSKTPDFAEGELVRNPLGFREYAVSEGRGLQKLKPEPGIPLTAYMSVLGGTGFTAYGGLLSIGQLKDGEQVFVSTAAGAVGSIAAQIAKIKGCYVIGSTGSDDKAAWLRDEAGLDAVINYKTTPIRQGLKAAAPKGVDVYFDNVGGEHLDAALANMNTLGRVAVCGMISGYNNAGARTPVYNLSNIIYGRINLRGFVATDFMHLRPQFESDMRDWLKTGRIKWRETVLEGIKEAPHAMVGLMQGENIGKMLVKLAD
ncbi:MAG TPA: NADP-dependent oxidoreductase [Phenylobacterium sp.]|uniref:NADP-dependent oxidoreductase n=1 Tax=Phenylobacterium sp. TaxID=1871053 RepID=UPI002C3DBB9F|nr:NADP-dependent oxidoreductase [Phenylobacterium sp.]HSV03550.1 NADP-dependent oxidoreductase [Phenylobacterium sp.]